MIQGRKKRSNNTIYIWIFAILWVLLGVRYIFANNDKSDDIDIGLVDSWSVMSGSDIDLSDDMTQYIAWANLIIDKTARPSIDVTILSNSVVFTDSMSSGTATLTYFNCQANDPTRNCIALTSSSNAVDTFTSDEGIVFAKQSDGSWIWSNDNTIWYKITTDDDQLFYDLSDVLIAVNKSYIESHISDIFQNYCYSSDSRMTSVTSMQTRNVADIWMTIVDGLDIDGNKVTCSISTTIEDGILMYDMTNYNQWSSNTISTGTITTWSQDNNDTVSVTDTDKNNQDKPSQVWTAPAVSSSGIVFNSTRGGYSVTFPSKNVLYQWSNVSTSLGLSDTNCYVDIWVKAYTDRDNSSIWNGVNIYECATKLSPSAIQDQLPDGHIVKTNTDWSKVFIIKSNDDSWNNFAQGIEIWALETTSSTGGTITVE